MTLNESYSVDRSCVKGSAAQPAVGGYGAHPGGRRWNVIEWGLNFGLPYQHKFSNHGVIDLLGSLNLSCWSCPTLHK